MRASKAEGVVVTGASTGIGRAAALQLDRQGFRVFAGVRREEDARSLAQVASERLRPLRLDVTDAASIEAAEKMVNAELGAERLCGLVNNAGISLPAPLEVCPIDDLRQQLEVNVVGTVAVTQRFLPRLRADRGRIVIVGSLSGRLAMPEWGAYSASKFALEGIADTWRRELRRFSVHVALVDPGATRTPIWIKAERSAGDRLAPLPLKPQGPYQPSDAELQGFIRLALKLGLRPEAVARKIVHALTARRPRSRYLVGVNAKTMAHASHLLPDAVVDACVRLMLRIGTLAAGGTRAPQPGRIAPPREGA